MSNLFFKRTLTFTTLVSFLLINIPIISFAQEAVQPGGQVGPTLQNAGINNDATPDRPSVMAPYTSESSTTVTQTAGVGEVAASCMATLSAQLAAGWVFNQLSNIVNTALSSVFSLEVPVKDNTQATKSVAGGNGTIPSMDAIAYCIVNGIIERILIDTTRWIQEGAEDGGPLFIQNPKKFFTDLADETLGEVLDTIVGDLDLCEPIRVSIKLNLLSGQPQMRERPAVCTLSEISDNYESFMDGNFKDGGWRSWFELTQMNNPDAIELEAMTAAAVEAEKRDNDIRMSLNWSKGIMGKYDADGNLIWPGKLLTDVIENTTGISADRIAFADEFNELVTAAVDLLIKRVFEGFDKGQFTL